MIRHAGRDLRARLGGLSFGSRFVGALIADPDRVGGALTLVGATIAARVVALAASVVGARLLGVSGFGAFGLIQSTVATFQVFAGFGLAETATKYVAELRSTAPARALHIARLSIRGSLWTGSLCTLLVLVLAPMISQRVPALADGELLIRLAAPTLLLGAGTSAQLGVLAGLQRFGTVASLNLLVGCLAAALLVAGALLGGLLGAVASLTIAALLGWALSEVAARRQLHSDTTLGELTNARRNPHAAQSSEWGVLVRFSLPAVAGGLLVAPVNWWCATMLAKSPAGLRELGVYNAASQWFLALMLIPGLIGQLSLPALARRVGNGDLREAAELAWQAVRANTLVGGLAAIVITVGSPLIMKSYGAEFGGGTMVLALSAATGAIVVGVSPVGHYLAATSRMWLGFAFNFAWAVVFVVGSATLVRFGAVGLASARLAAYLLLAIGLLAFAQYSRRSLTAELQDSAGPFSRPRPSSGK